MSFCEEKNVFAEFGVAVLPDDVLPVDVLVDENENPAGDICVFIPSPALLITAG